jgi:uncharacterized membrane protein YgaE (UPF0421/DUF939 family)
VEIKIEKNAPEDESDYAPSEKSPHIHSSLFVHKSELAKHQMGVRRHEAQGIRTVGRIVRHISAQHLEGVDHLVTGAQNKRQLTHKISTSKHSGW